MECRNIEDPIYQVSNRYLDVSEQSLNKLTEVTGQIEVAYQKFVTDFGPGEFSSYLRIYSPENILELSESITQTIEQCSWSSSNVISDDMRKSAVVFAETTDSDYFAYIPGVADKIYCFARNMAEIILIDGDVESLCEWVASSGRLVEPFDARYYKTFPRAQLRFKQEVTATPHSMADIRDMLTMLGAPSYYIETDSSIESFFRNNGMHASYCQKGEVQQLLIDLDLPAQPDTLKQLSKPIVAVGLHVSEFYELEESELLNAGFYLS